MCDFFYLSSRLPVFSRGTILVLLSVLNWGCEKGEPVLEEDVILQISVMPATILNLGDTAVVTVRAIEPDGRPVLDGARIQLTASGGSVDPEVRTLDGSASGVFTSGAKTGPITLTAQSGELGSDPPVVVEVMVTDRNVPIQVAHLSLNPSNLTEMGGRVTARLVVWGPDGEPLADKPVVFSSSQGSFAGNGTTLFTDARGQVFDTLQVGRVPESITEVEVTAVSGETSQTGKVTITTNQNPVPELRFSPAEPRPGDPVFFSGDGSLDPDGSVVTLQWDLGDGSVQEGERVSHTYAGAGTFVIILTVTDDKGASTSASQSLTVGGNDPPVAVFTFSPENPRVNDVIFFDGSQSTDPDGMIVSHHWTMGNGSVRDGVTPAMAYPGAGNYNVVLTVTDDVGGTATVRGTVRVSGNQSPEADFVFSPLSAGLGEEMVFDASPSRDPDGEIEEMNWSFGDGQSAEGRVVHQTYRRAGTFDVVLEVIDNEGGSDFISKRVTINEGRPPLADFTFIPESPSAGEMVTFDGTLSTDPDGDIVAYDWDFGNGRSGSGSVVSHVFLAGSNYAITLRVRDGDGNEDVAVWNLNVEEGGFPTPVLRLEPSFLAAPGGRLLLDGSGTTDPEDGLKDLRFHFKAIPPKDVSVQIPSGEGPIRQITVDGLTRGDRVVIVMTVTDRDGHEAQITDTIEAREGLANARPNAVLEMTPTTLPAPGGTLILDGSTTTDEDHGLTDLKFDFGIQFTGTLSVDITPSGPVRVVTLSDGRQGDSAIFNMVVTDPLGAQDVTFSTLTLGASAVKKKTGTAPIKVLQTSPPPAPLRIVLDAGYLFEKTPSNLHFTFDWLAGDQRISARVVPEAGVPSRAGATVFGARPGDRILFLVTAHHPDGREENGVLPVEVVR